MPDDGAVIVINRGPEGAGELAWMPDDRTYCLAVIREARAETSCKPLPKSWARIGIRLVTKGAATGAGTVFFAVVDGGHGPYAYQGATAPGPGTGPVHDATAAFAAGRTLSLLTYERPAGAGTPGDQYICSADNAICFPAVSYTHPSALSAACQHVPASGPRAAAVRRGPCPGDRRPVRQRRDHARRRRRRRGGRG